MLPLFGRWLSSTKQSSPEMPALAENGSTQEPRAIHKETTSSMAGFACRWSQNNCASEAVSHTQLQGCINSDKPPQGQWKFPMPCGGNSTLVFLCRHMSFTSHLLDGTKASSFHSTMLYQVHSSSDTLRSLDRCPTWPRLCCVSSEAGGAFRSTDLFHSLLE